MKKVFNYIKENWFFIRQDITSYLISTILYISLCFMTNYAWSEIGYILFECLVFYIPFWFIRVCFSATYHSNNWYHCKKWTRIMLCSGVFAIWLFPVKYSLVGCLGVALMCCLILYLVAIEVSQKRTLKRQLDNIVEKTSHKDIWAMNKDELYEHCRSCGLSEEDCRIF